MGAGQVRQGAGPPLGLGADPGALPEVRPARTVHFTSNFIRQKLKNAPGLVGVGLVRSDQGMDLPWAGLAPECFPRSARPQTMCFPENFKKQKLKNTPLVLFSTYPIMTVKVRGGPERGRLAPTSSFVAV